MQRCWEHIPLAAPLRVRNVGEAVGEGALHENSLETGNNLAPLINGVALEQGRAVMELDVVNGTAETVYVTLGIEQALATFRKSWQKTNAFLFPGGASGCIGTGDCSFGFPPDKRTVIVSDETGAVTGLVSGIVIHDVLTGQRIEPCEGCDPGEYRFEPRVALGNPRVYRIRLVVTDLGFLAPQPLGVNFGPFADLPLDAEVLPIPITGRTFGRVRECQFPGDTPFECESELVHQHYLALTEASLSLPWLRLSARISPIPELPALFLRPQPELFSGTLAVESYQWETAELSLPPLPLPPPP